MGYDANFLHYFRKISEKIEKNGNVMLKDLGLTLTQGQALAYLLGKEGKTATYKDMEAALEVAQSSAANMISRLETRGFVRTFTGETDKRIKRLELTQLGEDSIIASEKCIEELKNGLFQKLSEDEIVTLMDLLEKITN